MPFINATKLRNWNAAFAQWATPPGPMQQERCHRAVIAIKQAVSASANLQNAGVDVFAQGSYRNRTNVRQESDVDVCIRCTKTFFPVYPLGVEAANLGNFDYHYKYPEFKSDVGAALRSFFGSQHVRRGKKAFDIHETAHREDSDAVAVFGYREYFFNQQGQLQFYEGNALVPDGSNNYITSFPVQQSNNNEAKNRETNQNFRALTRIIKTLRNEMAENKIVAAEPIPSYLIECLVWNWPNQNFFSATWYDMALYFLYWAASITQVGAQSPILWEENHIKLLLGANSPWTRAQVNAFCISAYSYIGGQ